MKQQRKADEEEEVRKQTQTHISFVNKCQDSVSNGGKSFRSHYSPDSIDAAHSFHGLLPSNYAWPNPKIRTPFSSPPNRNCDVLYPWTRIIAYLPYFQCFVKIKMLSTANYEDENCGSFLHSPLSLTPRQGTDARLPAASYGLTTTLTHTAHPALSALPAELPGRAKSHQLK